MSLLDATATDTRPRRAQVLYWEIQALRDQMFTKLVEMATIHDERARELIVRKNPDGWIDLFAAITAWTEAGREDSARRAIVFARRMISLGDVDDVVAKEIDRLEEWMNHHPAFGHVRK